MRKLYKSYLIDYIDWFHLKHKCLILYRPNALRGLECFGINMNSLTGEQRRNKY